MTQLTTIPNKANKKSKDKISEAYFSFKKEIRLIGRFIL